MSAGTLFVLGATHQTAPLDVRERLALDAQGASTLASELAAIAGLREFALLATCNRLEFYGVAGAPDAVGRVQEAFCARQRFAIDEFEKFRLSLHGLPAVQHLFEVASGLDSQIVGETEIFGQVKSAYAAAQAKGSAGPVLNRVFQKTFQAAKLARTHSAITGGQVSIANVAVELALNIFGGLGAAHVLLLGAGEIGEKTARAFQSRGAGALTVASRSLDRAMALATALGASALPFEQREARLADFDVIVGSTASPDPVVAQEAVAAAMRKRPARPLFFIDLALPRDVDPEVAKLENVFLYNLDDLAKIAAANRAAREAEIEKCRALLGERSAVLWRQLQALLGAGVPVAIAPAGQPLPGSAVRGP